MELKCLAHELHDREGIVNLIVLRTLIQEYGKSLCMVGTKYKNLATKYSDFTITNSGNITARDNEINMRVEIPKSFSVALERFYIVVSIAV